MSIMFIFGICMYLFVWWIVKLFLKLKGKVECVFKIFVLVFFRFKEFIFLVMIIFVFLSILDSCKVFNKCLIFKK